MIDATARACARLGADVTAADAEGLASVELGGDLVTRGGRRVSLADVTGMLVRPDGRLTSVEAIAGYQALSAWAELTTAAVLNRPSAAASNRSKPYQLSPIRAAGFADVAHQRIPDPSPTPEVYTGRWFRDAAQLAAFKREGALLIHGAKNES